MFWNSVEPSTPSQIQCYGTFLHCLLEALTGFEYHSPASLLRYFIYSWHGPQIGAHFERTRHFAGFRKVYFVWLD
jgi:hypothetical protein